jgi:hypothetical protein
VSTVSSPLAPSCPYSSTRNAQNCLFNSSLLRSSFREAACIIPRGWWRSPWGRETTSNAKAGENALRLRSSYAIETLATLASPREGRAGAHGADGGGGHGHRTSEGRAKSGGGTRGGAAAAHVSGAARTIGRRLGRSSSSSSSSGGGSSSGSGSSSSSSSSARELRRGRHFFSCDI